MNNEDNMEKFVHGYDEYEVELQPDVHTKDKGWLNRLKLTSLNTAGEYVVSQRTTTYEWCCGCMAWRFSAKRSVDGKRDCKHLQALGLSKLKEGEDPPPAVIRVIGNLRWFAQKAQREAQKESS
jgi:hypothetical protein